MNILERFWTFNIYKSMNVIVEEQPNWRHRKSKNKTRNQFKVKNISEDSFTNPVTVFYFIIPYFLKNFLKTRLRTAHVHGGVVTGGASSQTSGEMFGIPFPL